MGAAEPHVQQWAAESHGAASVPRQRRLAACRAGASHGAVSAWWRVLSVQPWVAPRAVVPLGAGDKRDGARGGVQVSLLTPPPPSGGRVNACGEQQRVATPQAARGRISPPCRHFKKPIFLRPWLSFRGGGKDSVRGGEARRRPYSDAKFANRNARVWHGAIENGP